MKTREAMDLVAWIDAQEKGVTSSEVQRWGGWQKSGYIWSMLARLRSEQLLCLNGRGAGARWCTPRHLPSVLQLRADAKDAARERNNELHRLRYQRAKRQRPSRAKVHAPTFGAENAPAEIPRRMVEHGGRLVVVPIVPRSVFELGAME